MIKDGDIDSDLQHTAHTKLYRRFFHNKITGLERITKKPHTHHFYTEKKYLNITMERNLKLSSPQLFKKRKDQALFEQIIYDL